VGSMGA